MKRLGFPAACHSDMSTRWAHGLLLRARMEVAKPMKTTTARSLPNAARETRPATRRTPRPTTRAGSIPNGIEPTVDEPTVADVPVAPAKATPTRADIERRAYQRYLARDSAHGNDVGDWLDAERELVDGVPFE